MVLLAFFCGHLFLPTPHPSRILKYQWSFGNHLSSNPFPLSSGGDGFTLPHSRLWDPGLASRSLSDWLKSKSSVQGGSVSQHWDFCWKRHSFPLELLNWEDVSQSDLCHCTGRFCLWVKTTNRKSRSERWSHIDSCCSCWAAGTSHSWRCGVLNYMS